MASINAARCFFKLCQQRRLQTSLISRARRTTRHSLSSQMRTFTSSQESGAQAVEDSAQLKPQENQTSSKDRPTELFYGNLAFGVDETTVAQAFSKHGTVTRVRLPEGVQKESQKRQQQGWGGYTGGFCFVDFTSHEEANAALHAMNGAEIGGRAITLQYARPLQVRSKEKGDQTHPKKELLQPSKTGKKSLSARDQEYTRAQPLVTGTVSRTGTMLKTVAVTTNRRQLDSYTQTHHIQQETVLVHDPDGILVEGDVIRYQHFPPDLYAERSARGKTRVKYILKEVVTPFGTPVEERTPFVPAGPPLAKKSRQVRAKLEEVVAVT